MGVLHSPSSTRQATQHIQLKLCGLQTPDCCMQKSDLNRQTPCLSSQEPHLDALDVDLVESQQGRKGFAALLEAVQGMINPLLVGGSPLGLVQLADVAG